MSEVKELNWQAICDVSEILPNLGSRVIFEGKQVAVFNVKGQFYAVDAVDPFSKAAVLSRGIVGDLKGHVVVASPIYKQHFDLSSGVCLEDDNIKIKTYSVRERNGEIQLARND